MVTLVTFVTYCGLIGKFPVPQHLRSRTKNKDAPQLFRQGCAAMEGPPRDSPNTARRNTDS